MNEQIDDAHHSDNQRRFLVLETKIDANTVVTEKLARDTADLLEMWKDAGVFFRWMRRAGSALMWISKVVLAAGILWGAWRYGIKGKIE
ncbi:hypothetical protein [Polaromonas sp.]|uniref:hypothetical protein n=1 Tax=Polaromonas sp. TaxID=1869339 RepID=UPI00273125CA|nr:hypothetical protein [Polaromonas sp.]MDP1887098.1 hypothetical protein [Polaromonas sp.]